MASHAVEWRVYLPLTRVTIARIILRTIDGIDYYVGLRDDDGQKVVLGSWDALGTAENSIVAMHHLATGETVYGDPQIDRYLKVHEQTPLPGVAPVHVADAGTSRQAAMPPLRSSRR